MQTRVDMPSILEEYRKISRPYQDSFFQKKIQEAELVSKTTADLLQRLHALSALGKKVRGFLVVLGYQLAGGTDFRAIYDASVFIEIAQTGLLIHDDIMDEDTIRRGQTTIQAFYQAIGEKANAKPTPKRFGENMAICAGDIAFYISWEKLFESNFAKDLLVKAATLYAESFTRVAYGQVLDVSSSMKKLTESEILLLHRLKTAEYSGALPLLIGATLAGATDTNVLKSLRLYGLNLGLIFQIQDDILGTFGDENSTGKPVGSDIREGKQTILVSHFLSHMDEKKRNTFLKFFGNVQIGAEEVQTVQQLFRETGSLEHAQQIAQGYFEEAKAIISNITIDKGQLGILSALLLFILQRQK